MISHRASSIRRAGVLLLAAAAIGAGMGGCRGERSAQRPRQFFPDMDEQPKYKAQAKSTFFKDYTAEDGSKFGRTMREPVVGTIAFGRKPWAGEYGGVDFGHRSDYLKEDDQFYRGVNPVLDADGRPVLDETGKPREMYLERMPIPVTAELVNLGQQKFEIFCIVCHGGTGAGDGLVGTRWSYPLPTWHAPQYERGGEKGQDGYLFHVIRNGVPNVGETAPYPLKMPSYASKVSEREAWAIVAYIRALQMSQSAPIDMLPERERTELQRGRAASAGGGAGASGKGGAS